MYSLTPPYTPTLLDVTSGSNQEVIVDLGTLPVRLSVQTDCSGTADTKYYGANDLDGFVQLGSTISAYPALTEFPTVSFRYFKVTVTPTGSQDIAVVLNTKL